MIVPISCRKKISAIDKGAIVSAVPLLNPMRIQAARKLAYEYVNAVQIAHARYSV
jgi:preprotein translocase subunit Sec63